MTQPDCLEEAELRRLEAYATVGDAGYAGLERVILEHEGIQTFRPSALGAADDREGLPVLYSEARLHRPHDTGSREQAGPPPCPVCAGKLTPMVDRAELGGSLGTTFITPNLYPIVVPAGDPVRAFTGRQPATAEPVSGMHFVQWCSTRHDLDLHNLPPAAIVTLLERLAAFEEVFLYDRGAARAMPEVGKRGNKRLRGYLGFIKNFGAPVGGSLSHGHQQLAHLSIEPLSVRRDEEFATRHGMSYDEWLRRETPAEQQIRTYSGGVRLLAPPAARRPLEANIVAADSSCSFLHELSPESRQGFAEALGDATATLHHAMPQLGRMVSFNLIFHLSPAAGVFIEVLPYTQEIGGYERLGVYLSHAHPGTYHKYFRNPDALGF